MIGATKASGGGVRLIDTNTVCVCEEHSRPRVGAIGAR